MGLSDIFDVKDNVKAVDPQLNTLFDDAHVNYFFDAFSAVFTKQNVIALCSFLVVYYCLYYILGKHEHSSSEGQRTLKHSVDFLILSLMIITTLAYYFGISTHDKQNMVQYAIRESEDFFTDPTMMFTLVIFIVLFYLTIFVCGIPMSPEFKPVTISFIEYKLFVCLICVIMFNTVRFLFGVDLPRIVFGTAANIWKRFPNQQKTSAAATSTTSNWTKSAQATKDASANVVKPPPKREVFNISNNLYTYDDAKAVCQVFDARLATYDEVEGAYNDGGEWCNYGWTEGQMALFPTQKKTWNELQNHPEHKNSCGRPGVNGGYMENSKLSFGVNCFGIKPDASANDLAMMAANKDRIHPKTINDRVVEAKVNYWKKHKDKILQVNSFNRDKWKEY